MTAIALQANAETTAAIVTASGGSPLTSGTYIASATCAGIERRFNALRESATAVINARGVEAKREAIFNLSEWLTNTASA